MSKAYTLIIIRCVACTQKACTSIFPHKYIETQNTYTIKIVSQLQRAFVILAMKRAHAYIQWCMFQLREREQFRFSIWVYGKMCALFSLWLIIFHHCHHSYRHRSHRPFVRSCIRFALLCEIYECFNFIETTNDETFVRCELKQQHVSVKFSSFEDFVAYEQARFSRLNQCLSLASIGSFRRGNSLIRIKYFELYWTKYSDIISFKR